MTPRPTAIDLRPILTSEVTVVNLADRQVTLTVTLLDPESTDEFEVGTLGFEPLQVTSQAILPARLRLEFEFSGGAVAGVCTIDIEDGERIQFAVTETGIAITAGASEPEDPADLIVATASRCRAGGGS